jgi:hypothetical protein
MAQLPIGTVLKNNQPGAGYNGTITRHHENGQAVEIAWHKWHDEDLLDLEWHPEQYEVISIPPTATSVTITQAQYDAYNRRYDNATYRAFTEKVKQLQRSGTLHAAPPDFYGRVADLLINASFGRVGVAGYAGQEAELLALVTPYSQQLAELAQDHLDNFAADPQPSFKEDLGALNDTAHRLCSQASDRRGCQGRAAFYFLDAACYLLMMACTVYTRSGVSDADVDYFNEKFRRALKAGLNGLTELEKGDE